MKKKGIRLQTVLLVILGIAILYPFINFYLEGWQSLTIFGNIERIEVNRSNGDLWGIGNRLYHYRPQLGNIILWGKRIALPTGYWKEYPKKLCPSQQIWVIYHDNLISYDPEKEMWRTDYPELASIGHPVDCFYINEEIAILGEKAIAIRNGTTWKEIRLPLHDETYREDVVQNQNGEWLLIIGRTFYKLNELTEDWELITTYQAPKSEDDAAFLLDVYTYDNYYWEGVGLDSVGRIQVLENNIHMDILESISSERAWTLEAVEDNFGRVWLASSEGAWIFENGELSHFFLPNSIGFVSDIAVDPERGRIYILGSTSITYRSTDYNP